MSWRAGGHASSPGPTRVDPERKHGLRLVRARRSEVEAPEPPAVLEPEHEAGSPNSRWVLSGPFTRIHDREELLEDLEYAVKPRTTATVLVLFGFKKLAERLDVLLEPDGNLLLGRIAARLAESAEMAAVLYEPRRGEFCGLFSGQLDAVQPVLDTIAADVNDEVRSLGIETVLGVVSLPGEARDPIGALRLADQRREQLAGKLRPSPRRTAYARIAATLHLLRDAEPDG